MSFDKNAPYVYGKGSVDFTLNHPTTYDLVFFTNKGTAGGFNSSVNLNPILAGPGNVPVISIPDGQSITMEFTAADQSLIARGLNVGEMPRYGGVVKIAEPTTVTSGKIRLLQKAVPQLGNNTGVPYAWVGGTAYRVDEQDYLVGYVGKEGDLVCVEYCIMDMAAQQFDINTLFSPMIGIATVRQYLFATEGADVNTGSRVGEDIYTIPRFQFNGNVSTDFSQTAAASTPLTGTALSYDEGLKAGSVCDTSMTKLAYVTRRLYGSDAYSNVEGLTVIGGGVTIPIENEQLIPFKLAMNNGQLMQPRFGDFDYVSLDEAVATVSEAGVVTGVADGNTAISIKHKTIERLEIEAKVYVVT